MKVLISDKSSPKCGETLRNAGHTVDEKPGMLPEELKQVIGEYDALIVRSATKVTAEIIEAGKNLKVIGRAGAGVDNIDVDAASKKNIVVMNTPGANTNAVVELTLTYLFALSRHLYDATYSMKNSSWEKKKLVGTEISGKVLGIIGCGKIGRNVAIKAKCLGMKVIAYDPIVSKESMEEIGVELIPEMKDVLIEADYLSIHVPKAPETTNMFTKKEFQLMKKGAYLVNCGRGGIVNEEDLIWALDEGILAGAGVDVFEKEPPSDYKLARHSKVICSPHIGASSVEAQENVGIMIAEQIADMFADKGIRNVVNPK